jgi:GxxExxY protein
MDHTETRGPAGPERIVGRLVEGDLTKSIIGAFYDIYNQLNFGFLEAIYVEALSRELVRQGHSVEREVGIRVYCKGEVVGLQRIDLLVDRKVIVEVKSTHDLAKAAHRQLLAYLRGSDVEVGLLLHFGPKPEFFRVIASRKRQTEDQR